MVDSHEPGRPTVVRGGLDHQGSPAEGLVLNAGKLREEGIETVVLASQEAHGRLVGRRVPAGEFAGLVEAGPTLPSCVLAWDFAQNMEIDVAYAGLHTGYHDVVLRPDTTTLRRAGWLDATAICLCDFQEVSDGSSVPIGPRNLLRTQLEWATELGIKPVVASELEFYLFRPGYDDARRADYRNLEPTLLAASDFSVRAADAFDSFFRSLRQALSSSGIGVEFLQPETGLGQWEVNFGHADALRMADDHAIFKHAVKVIARENGMSATFMARPSAGDMGSSGHLHISLLGPDGPLFHDPQDQHGIHPRMRAAIGGVLQYAPDLMLFYAPNVNSYKRTTSGDFAGCGGSWGIDNRTTSCRAVGSRPEATRFEFRVPGADANPYLAIAALVASAIQGVLEDADPGPAVVGNAYDQVGSALPANLGEAVRAMQGSEFAASRFGAEAVDHYARLAEWEDAKFSLAVTDWETERYFENA
jgi:glutamine synthetase